MLQELSEFALADGSKKSDSLKSSTCFGIVDPHVHGFKFVLSLVRFILFYIFCCCDVL